MEARHDGKSYSELAELDQRIAIDQIMFRSAASSGAALPQTEMFAKFIAEEISAMILEFGYEDFTLSEFLLAIRFNANGSISNPAGENIDQIQFSGNCINTVYLMKIFKNYRVLRNNLDSRLKNLIDGHQ